MREKRTYQSALRFEMSCVCREFVENLSSVTVGREDTEAARRWKKMGKEEEMRQKKTEEGRPNLYIMDESTWNIGNNLW